MFRLSATQIKYIRRCFLAGGKSGAQIAAELDIHTHSVLRQLKEFREIRKRYPRKQNDLTFRLPTQPLYRLPFREDLALILPELIEATALPRLESTGLYLEYKTRYPEGCTYNFFYLYYTKWQAEQQICKYYPKHIKFIPITDLAELQHWRKSRDLRHWKKAVVILDSLNKRPIKELTAQLNVNKYTILDWIRRYQQQGIKGLSERAHTPNPRLLDETLQKRENIRKLLQQTPHAHGINRTAWSITHLAIVYKKVYGTPLGNVSVGKHLAHMGYQFKKSRERLASPDQHYAEKMIRIKSILANLKPDERFFSVDEYGPKRVIMRTGWSITQQDTEVIVAARQKSKGWYILTAALELSTNQVTHFYSKRKDSAEMIRLIDVLLEQYRSCRTIYLSWDAASWHSSTQLKAYLNKINTSEYRKKQLTPRVELAALPSCTQYLNIIESVFSGMAKTIIHNSNYESLEACQQAIDTYFAERNAHFLAHPKKAGQQIWKKEVVPVIFKEVNNCRSGLKPSYRNRTKQ